MTDYIHHNQDRIHYSVTEDELNNITNRAQPLWKDVCLVLLSLGIPTLINAIAETASQKTFQLSMSLFLNYFFGGIGIILGIIFGIAWKKSHTSTKELIDKIKSKPKMELKAATSDVGALESREPHQPTEKYPMKKSVE